MAPELKEKALVCKTAEELFELAKSEGMELTQEQLDAVMGAGDTIWYSCDDKACPTNCARKKYAHLLLGLLLFRQKIFRGFSVNPDWAIIG